MVQRSEADERARWIERAIDHLDRMAILPFLASIVNIPSATGEEHAHWRNISVEGCGRRDSTASCNRSMRIRRTR